MSFFGFNAQDIALDDSGDLLIENGDFATTKSDGMHIQSIIESSKGNWRFSPALGVDILGYVNATGTMINTKLRKSIKTELENDGYLVESIQFPENQPIQITAKRIR